MQSQSTFKVGKKLKTYDAFDPEEAESEMSRQAKEGRFTFSDLKFEDIEDKEINESDVLPPECISRPEALNIKMTKYLVNKLFM